MCALGIWKFFATKYTFPSFCLLEREHIEMFKRFFQHLLKIFLTKLFYLMQNGHSH